MYEFVDLRDVVKEYHMGEVSIKAVNGVNFQIKEGEFVVIVGPSGAGKTTVLNILGGMDTATSGQVMVGGQDISKFNEKQLTNYRRDDIGFVFQFYNLVQNLTAKENVEFSTGISAGGGRSSSLTSSLGSTVTSFCSSLATASSWIFCSHSTELAPNSMRFSRGDWNLTVPCPNVTRGRT